MAWNLFKGMQVSTPTPSLANQPSKGRTAHLYIETNMICYFMQEDWYCILVHEMHLPWSGIFNTTSPVLVSKSVTNWFVVSSTEVRIDALTSTLPRLGCTPPQLFHWLCNDKTESKFTQEQHYIPPAQIPQTWNPKWHRFSGRIFPPGKGSLTMSSCTSFQFI